MMAPTSQLKIIYDTDTKLINNIKDICFAGKVHFLKNMFREMRGHSAIYPDITNNLFLLYCLSTNNNWVLDANITTKSEFYSLIHMHKPHVLEWYRSCIHYILRDIHNVLEYMIKNDTFTTYGPSIVKMINTELQNTLSSIVGYRTDKYNKDSIVSLENMDLLLTHELIQLDTIGMKKHAINKSGSALISRKLVNDLLRKVWVYTTDFNINNILVQDIYSVLVIYSFISKLFTNSHIRTFIIPSSENTTYEQILSHLMNTVHTKISHNTESPLYEIFNKLKEYKCYLATNKVFRSMTNHEAIVFGCSCHTPYIRTIEDKLEENNIIGNVHDIFDIVMTRDADFYVLLSLIYQDIVEGSLCEC